MLKTLMALIGYTKVPVGIVHASLHQESGLRLLLASAELDLIRAKDIQKQANKTKEIVHLEEMIELQKELTTYLQSCRRLVG